MASNVNLNGFFQPLPPWAGSAAGLAANPVQFVVGGSQGINPFAGPGLPNTASFFSTTTFATAGVQSSATTTHPAASTTAAGASASCTAPT